jgi:putative phosphoribosyl transferase
VFREAVADSAAEAVWRTTVQRFHAAGCFVIAEGVETAAAAAVAQAIGAPLDVILVRKLRAPQQPELALGALDQAGAPVLNRSVIQEMGVSAAELEALVEFEREELEQARRQLRARIPRISLHDKTAIVVDDGIATGATARAACQIVRAMMASRVVLATPVAAPQALAELQGHVDELVCLLAPHRFSAVGWHYRDFSPASDEQVLELLHANRAAPGRGAD